MFGSKGVGEALGAAIKQRRMNLGSIAAPSQTSSDMKEFNTLGLGKGNALGSQVLPQVQGGYEMGQAAPTSIAIRRRRVNNRPFRMAMGGF